MPAALAAGSAEAGAAFSDGAVYLEREMWRVIEVQLLGDSGGAMMALGEQELLDAAASTKLVEEIMRRPD